jgi:predicted PurR-regulated permease PerM
MESGRKFVVLNRPASGESSHSVFGLDIRILRMVSTLAVCYLLFRLRAVLLLLVLSIAVACILLPAVEITYRFLTHRRHKRGALALIFLIVLTILRMLADYVIQPVPVGSAGLGISAIVIIFGALAGETIAGVLGLLLSVPVLATLRLLYRHAVKVKSGQRPNSWEPGPAIPY